MKNVIQLLSIILISSLPVLSTAQVSVGLLTAPFSSVRTTKILVPVGVEINSSS